MNYREFANYIMIVRVPISNENGIVPSRVREWNWDSWSAENPDPSKASSCLVEG